MTPSCRLVSTSASLRSTRRANARAPWDSKSKETIDVLHVRWHAHVLIKTLAGNVCCNDLPAEAVNTILIAWRSAHSISIVS